MADVAVSVLTPVLNEERHIDACVRAMTAQQFPGELEFLLVDGGSSDRTRERLLELAAADPRIRVLENPRRGTPSGLNVALAHARGRWVARMDAHSEYPRDYLALGVERLQRGGTSWVSGPQDPVGQGRFSRAVAAALKTPLGRGGSGRWGRAAGGSGEYQLDSGVFCGVWERETLLRSGGWDERWLRNQDSEMAGRFLAAGERLVCLPAMAARYTPRSTPGRLWRQYYEYGVYRAWTARRHPETLRRSHLLAPGVVAALAGALLGRHPAGRLSRAGLGLYAAVLVGGGVRGAQAAGEPGLAPLVPVALAAMHIGHGAGFWRQALSGRPPVAALLRVAGLGRLAARLSPPDEPVDAPSLGDGGSGEPWTTASAAEAQNLGHGEREDPQIEAQ